MMTTLAFVLLFVIAALFVYMARFSGRLIVEPQTRLIAAPLADVYAQVADFRHWQEWSPWLEHDPQATISLDGDPVAAGGRYAWESERAGAGEVRHSKLIPLQRIEQRIVSRHPFRFRGRSYWVFTERNGQTEVSWSMKGRVGFALRAFAPTVRGMIALDARYALDRLARLVEPVDGNAATAHYSLDYLGVRDVPATHYVYRTYSGPLTGVGEAMPRFIAELRTTLAAAGADAVGEPIAVYVKTNIKLRTTVCHIGIPVAAPASDALPTREMLAHRAYVLRLTGSYTALEVAWYQAMQRLRMDGLQPDQRIAPFERYLNDSSVLPTNEWQTELYLPLRDEAMLPNK